MTFRHVHVLLCSMYWPARGVRTLVRKCCDIIDLHAFSQFISLPVARTRTMSEHDVECVPFHPQMREACMNCILTLSFLYERNVIATICDTSFFGPLLV